MQYLNPVTPASSSDRVTGFGERLRIDEASVPLPHAFRDAVSARAKEKDGDGAEKVEGL